MSAAHILGLPLAASNLPGIPVQELVQHQLLLHADHAVVGAAHAYVGLVGGAAGEDALVGGGNVRVRAEHRGHAAIQMPAHGDFFAGGLGVEVDHDDFGLERL